MASKTEHPARLQIGDRLVGIGQPCYIIAEIGINHNGDMDLAKEMIEAAAKSGADAVKFQNYRVEDFLADPELTYTYVSQGDEVTERQVDLFARCELGRDDVRDLAAVAQQAGLDFLSTPTSQEGIQDLVDAGAPALKNGSDFLGNVVLIRQMAETGLATIISTGMAFEEDIEDAVKAFRSAGGQDLILLHCVSMYPTPLQQANLRRMVSLADRFDCVVGFSDHTEGTVAACTAVALGAAVIERHFTLDHGLPGPDHRFSTTPDEFVRLVEAIRAVETCLGDGELAPAEGEAANREAYRLSCVAARALPEGHVIRADDVACRRPGGGFLPKNADLLAGKTLRRPVSRGHVFTDTDLA